MKTQGQKELDRLKWIIISLHILLFAIITIDLLVFHKIHYSLMGINLNK
jgi:hypothetical protein